MALPEALSLELDYAQTRVKVDAQTVLAQCSYDGVRGRAVGWDPSFLSSCWQDPVTFSLWLTPNVNRSEWATTFSGIYARMQLTDFTFTTAASWKLENHLGSGDYWMNGNGFTATETGISNSAMTANQPMWVGWFVPNTDANNYIVLECGWSDTGDLTAGVGLRVYASGDVEVWKDGAYEALYKISGSQTSDYQGQKYTGMIMVPCRKRELLVIAKGGAGFSHAFDDLDESLAEPTVTPAEKFFIRAPYQSATRSLLMQVAKVQYASSGSAVSTLLSFADIPQVEQEPTTYQEHANLYGGTLTSELVETDGSTVFFADGVLQNCRIKASLTGDGTRTPFVYGVLAKYPAIVTLTAEAPMELRDYCTEAVLTVGETAGSVSMGVTLARVEDLETEAASLGLGDIKLRSQANRPVRLRLGDEGPLVMGGRTGPPKWTGSTYDNAGLLTIECFDRWKTLQEYVFRDVVPLDGLLFTDALKKIIGIVFGDGVDEDRWDIEDTDFTIPENSSQTAGEWTCAIEAGDRASMWVERLFENYAPDWFYGFVPTLLKTKFRARSVTTLDWTPILTLFDTAEEAIAALVGEGHSEEDASKLFQTRVFRTYRTTNIEPEATEVRVTGWDPRTGTPIHTYKTDHDAENPETNPPDRPANWCGVKKPYGWVDTAINSLDLAERCRDRLYKKLTKTRVIAEWECGLLQRTDGSLVWRGDMVALNGIGNFRVTSLKCDFVKEPDWAEGGNGTWMWRVATYCGELVPEDTTDDAWRGTYPVVGIDAVALAASMRAPEVYRAARGAEFLLKRNPGSVTAP